MLLLKVEPINLIKGCIKMPKKKKEKESWVAKLKKKVRKHFEEKKKEEKAFKATLKKVKDKKAAAKSKPESKKKAPYPGLKGRTQRGLKQAGVKFKTDQEKAKEKKKKKNNPHKKSGGY